MDERLFNYIVDKLEDKPKLQNIFYKVYFMYTDTCSFIYRHRYAKEVQEAQSKRIEKFRTLYRESRLYNLGWKAMVDMINDNMVHAYYNQKTDILFTISFEVGELPRNWVYLGKV